ncbi:MAG: mandelate racemase/muconate lactonizing enzyme family protein, partial [uncultured Thermomicrobiales bacterium]
EDHRRHRRGRIAPSAQAAQRCPPGPRYQRGVPDHRDDRRRDRRAGHDQLRAARSRPRRPRQSGRGDSGPGDHRRRPRADPGDPRQALATNRLPRHRRAGAARNRRDRHCPLGFAGAGDGAAGLAAARRAAGPRAGLRDGRLVKLRPHGVAADLRAGDRGGLSRGEDEGRRGDPGRGCGADPGDPRGDRRRAAADGRRQPSLRSRGGAAPWPGLRGVGLLLVRGAAARRRHRRAGRAGRRADDPDRLGREQLRQAPVSAPLRGSRRGHRAARPASRRGRDRMPGNRAARRCLQYSLCVARRRRPSAHPRGAAERPLSGERPRHRRDSPRPDRRRVSSAGGTGLRRRGV